MEKLCCKVCGRSFPSPRSLGVHMRSHVLLKSEEESMCRYGLRENPRKSWRLKEKEDMLCTKSYKHMKSHYEMGRDAPSVGDDGEDEKRRKFKKKEKDLKSNRSCEEEEDEMQSQTDSEVTAVVFPATERRKRRRSLVSSPEHENEEKMGAFCLMMLSRGAGSVSDSSDKFSVATDKEAEKKRSISGFRKIDFEMNELKKIQSFPKYDFGTNELKMLQSFPSESEFSHKLKKSNASPHKKVLNSAISELRQRRRYKCKTCNKGFPSYQALGGHMASHKKIKSISEIPATEELNIQNLPSKLSDEAEWTGTTAANVKSFEAGYKIDHRITGLDLLEDVHFQFSDHSHWRHVPVGPDHQADLPKWTSPDSYDEASDKWLGTCVIPMPDRDDSIATQVISFYSNKICCDCSDEGSIKCVRKHVMDAREKLFRVMGQEEFIQMGFSHMGEIVAQRWTEEEETLFHQVVLSNPESAGRNFWVMLPMAFPSTSFKELVSYYFNVFMLRKRAHQNRFDRSNVDSDSDEWQESRDVEFPMSKEEDEEQDSVVESSSDVKNVAPHF